MTPRERLFQLEQFGIKLGLEHIQLLLEALNHPESHYPSVHIAGTNGKGSVTAIVERGLRAAGHRTGRYTSPHLSRIEERMAIDGEPITSTHFDNLAAEVLAVVDRLRGTGDLRHLPTFFEVTTAMAFAAFRAAKVTAAVIEVGLGGRFDATNVIQPQVTAITSIAFDHERHLGTTLDAIAFEKAGIIKPGVPVVVGPVPAEARAVIVRTAAERHAPVIDVRPGQPGDGEPLQLALKGAHQQANAAVAVEVLRQLAGMGFGVTRGHMVTALTEVEWPARLEWLGSTANSPPFVLLDAAHNPHGAAALAEYVRDTEGRLPFVLAMMRDKRVHDIVSALAPVASRIVTTQVDSSRSLSADDLADEVRRAAPNLAVMSRPDPDEALQAALADAPRVVVAGSIFLVGPLRERLISRGARPVRYSRKASPFYLASSL